MMATMTRTAVLMLVTVATLSATAMRADAQVRYVDRDGVAHWVQSETQVPAEYRAERPALPATGGGSGSGVCATGDPKKDAACNRAAWRDGMNKLCYGYGANTDNCREYRRVNAERNVRQMMRP